VQDVALHELLVAMNCLSQGSFIAVVGPSGAGKDSLIGYAKQRLHDDKKFHFPTRFITRPTDKSEPCESMTTDAFLSAAKQNAFILHWQAHGLHYGISAKIKPLLSSGCSVVANVSRSVIPNIRQSFARHAVILITAHPDILAERLQSRNREASDDQLARLKRSADASLVVKPDFMIENNSSLEVAGDAFMDCLKQSAVPQTFLLGL
jgi:ribose 1,5-bisphosphokinase